MMTEVIRIMMTAIMMTARQIIPAATPMFRLIRPAEQARAEIRAPAAGRIPAAARQIPAVRQILVPEAGRIPEAVQQTPAVRQTRAPEAARIPDPARRPEDSNRI